MSEQHDDTVDWLVDRIAGMLGLEPEEIEPDEPFAGLGLTSLQAIELSEDLQRRTGLLLSPTLAYDHPTIERLAAHLRAATGDDPAGPAAPAAEQAGPAPVAIVGIGCRLPGADGPEAFWRLLADGTDAVDEVPADRWDAAALYDPDRAAPGRMNTRWGGFLGDVQGFDNDFFGISAREAARMDPQQRITLEVAWEALGDAGIAPDALAGSRTGVYLGVSTFDHGTALFSALDDAQPHDGTGGALSIAANRISYLLDLRGPSMAVDTACSSSLVAVHLACQALRTGEADLALAGGVNVIASPRVALSFSKGGLMAADGRCKPFDESADGYVRSEGSGVVVLKPLDRALADGDRVYAVVRGGAVNQDGRTNGLTAPNRLSQEDVLADALRAAGTDPADVDYVEAHGTGTAIGDPIEVGALATVLGAGRPADRPLLVGSVKSNVGHLEAAAGVTGVIKTALALHHRWLPPTVHYRRANPMLGLDRVPVRVATGEAWPQHPDRPALAGVSSFGFGGSNAHLVLAGAPAATPDGAATGPAEDARPLLLPLSARSEQGLADRAAAWAALARAHAGDPGWPARAAAAAALRANHERHREAVPAADRAELLAGLDAVAAGDAVSRTRGSGRRTPRPVLVFPGQGSQWAGMGRQLAASEPAFREAIHRCDAALRPWLGRSLWSDDTGLVAEGTAEVPPALFAVQVALAATWRAWGVRPAAVVGHSMGEIAAAHVSGALSLEDAARLVCERSRLLVGISGVGGLALVELSADEAADLLRGREHELSVAACNGPRATVLSGSSDALDDVLELLRVRGVFARRIAVEFAAHSPQVEPLRPLLVDAIAGIAPRPADVPLHSTVTGRPVDGTDLGPDYWSANLRQPVRFDRAIAALMAEGHDTFLEIAPHPVLARPIAELADAEGRPATVHSSLRRGRDELHAMLTGLGALYADGADVDWPVLHPDGAAHQDLPRPAWQHRAFPLLRPAAGRAAEPATDGLLGTRTRIGAAPDLALWDLPLDLDRAPELVDHQVEDLPLVPGAYWLAAAGEAALALHPDADAVELTDVAFVQPHRPAPTADRATGLQLAARPGPDGGHAFTVTSFPTPDRTVTHAHGTVAAPAGPPPTALLPVADLLADCPADVPVDGHYEALTAVGLQYGPLFRGLTELRAGQRQALARVVLPDALRERAGRALPHPALLDACLHTVAAATGGLVDGGALPLPAGAERIRARRGAAAPHEVWCHARVTGRSGDELRADVTVADLDGRPLWTADGLRVHLTAPRRPRQRGGLYETVWQPLPAPARTPQPAPATGGWLLLAGGGADDGPARDLAERLTAAGERVLTAVGHRPPVGDGELALPDGPDGHAALLELAGRRFGGLHAVVDTRPADPATGDLDAAGLHRPAAAALHAVRAAEAHPDAPRLWLVTAGTQGPDGGTDARTLPGAAVWGLLRVAANEQPHAGRHLVDLPAAQPATAQDLDALTALIRSAEPPLQAAVRDGRVHTPALAPVTAPAADPDAPAARADRAYVVTGGLGALGLHTARLLAARGARHLVLLGRSAPGPAAREAVDRLRADGVDVTVESADLADPAGLAAALERSGALRRGIAGVHHLAGVLEDAPLHTLDEDGLRRAAAGKALGAWHLHRLTADQPVEEFVLSSSLAGLLGSPGQAAYAAANTVLDALARHRAAAGLPALAVAWGPWAGEGLAVAAGGVDRLAAMGFPALETAVGVDLLDEALRCGRTGLAATALDPAAAAGAGLGPAFRQLLLPLLPQTRPDTAAADPADARGAVKARVLAAGSEPERREILHRHLTGEVAGMLGVPEASLADGVPFQELGFDSLMAVELRGRLERALDLRLSATLVYAHPTADALTDALCERLAPATGSDAAAQPLPPRPAAPAPVADTPTAGDPTAGDPTVDDLAGLDDDQIAAALARELELDLEALEMTFDLSEER